MIQNSKTYIAGYCGLVGAAIVRKFEMHGYKNIIYRTEKNWTEPSIWTKY